MQLHGLLKKLPIGSKDNSFIAGFNRKCEFIFSYYFMVYLAIAHFPVCLNAAPKM
jgi:hypothetical protein